MVTEKSLFFLSDSKFYYSIIVSYLACVVARGIGRREGENSLAVSSLIPLSKPNPPATPQAAEFV